MENRLACALRVPGVRRPDTCGGRSTDRQLGAAAGEGVTAQKTARRLGGGRVGMLGTGRRITLCKGGSGGRGGRGGSLSLDDNDDENEDDEAGHDDSEESEVTGLVAAEGAGGVCSGAKDDTSLFS